MKKFQKHLEKKLKQDKLFSIVYYGASTTSIDYIFPGWGDIIRYWLRDYIEENIGEYSWNLQTVNRGLDGANSGHLLERFPQMIESLDPDLVFLNNGTNDHLYKMSKEETEKNTRELIEKSLKNGYKVVFATSVPALTEDSDQKIKPYVDLDRKIAREFIDNEEFMFIDFYHLFSKEDIKRSYTLIPEEGNIEPGEIDPIHFNKYGNALVAEIFLKEVFGLEFDREKFIQDLSDNTKKYPGT